MSNDITVAGSLIQIISQSRQNALKKVNEELINMYWRVGEYLSTESAKALFGDAYIDSIAEGIQDAFPGIKGFNRSVPCIPASYNPAYQTAEQKVAAFLEDHPKANKIIIADSLNLSVRTVERALKKTIRNRYRE